MNLNSLKKNQQLTTRILIGLVIYSGSLTFLVYAALSSSKFLFAMYIASSAASIIVPFILGKVYKADNTEYEYN